MRANEFIPESDPEAETGFDKNGLKLSNSTDSGYYLVSMLSSGDLAGKFIPYANVRSEDLQAAKVDFERSQGGSLVPGFFGHKNVIGLSVEEDVRDAAYVAQSFSGEHGNNTGAPAQTLRDNNLEELLINGNVSIIPKSPGNWQHPPAEQAIERMHQAKSRAPRKREPKLDSQSAMFKVWNADKSSYVVAGTDAASIRADIDSQNPTNNNEYLAAATNALEKYKK